MEKNVLQTDLSGKVAVVTGAGGVLCSYLAKVLARAGAKVALVNRSEGAINQYAAEIVAEGGIAKAYKGNVLSKEDMERIADQILADFGPVDIDESTLPPLELMQFDFSDENGAAAQRKIWAPQKIGEENTPNTPQEPSPAVVPADGPPTPERRETTHQAPLMKAVETDDAEIWGDLFKFKFPGMKHADKSSANPPRPPKNTQGFFDFGDES